MPLIPAVDRKPRSSRDIPRELGLTQTQVLKVLHEDQLHPHYCSRSAHLCPNDRSLRMQLPEWLQREQTAALLLSIFATFCGQMTREIVPNVHSSIFWTLDNPRHLRPRVSAPYEGGPVSAPRRRDSLEDGISGLQEVLPVVRQRIRLQHDGASVR
jgi:hypothetical protein